MRKFIKMISILLIFCFVFPFSIPVKATYEYANDKLDLSQYTVEEVVSLPKEEFLKLLSDFERIYDPFDTYKTDPIFEQSNMIQPLWVSGDFEGEELLHGSHETITAAAVIIMNNDIGFFYEDTADAVAALLTLAIASILPDKYETAIGFEGHFYHGLYHFNYLGQVFNTALTNTQTHYAAALLAVELGDKDNAIKEIGKALHYIQDVSEPHHASNIIAGMKNNVHGVFEEYVDLRVENYLEGLNSAYSHKFENTYQIFNYNLAYSKDVKYLVDGAASIAYEYRDKVVDIADKSQWDLVCKKTVSNAAVFSAFLLAKFAYDSGWSLYKS